MGCPWGPRAQPPLTCRGPPMANTNPHACLKDMATPPPETLRPGAPSAGALASRTACVLRGAGSCSVMVNGILCPFLLGIQCSRKHTRTRASCRFPPALAVSPGSCLGLRSLRTVSRVFQEATTPSASSRPSFLCCLIHSGVTFTFNNIPTSGSGRCFGELGRVI